MESDYNPENTYRLGERPDAHMAEFYRVRSYECDAFGCIQFPNICNYLQEIAGNHAELLGVTQSNSEFAELAWVLTRMKVRLVRYPRWMETVKVLTFPRSMRKLFAYRDFVLTLHDGTPIGTATSEWMVINMQTRKAVRIPEIVSGIENKVREPVLGENPFSKYEFPGDTPCHAAKRFSAQRSHIDLNGHVNNVHYLEWMLECVPNIGEPKRVCEMEATFRSEALMGDTVVATCANASDDQIIHRVASGEGKEHIIAKTTWGVL